MIFQYINVCPVPREMLKTSAYGLGFQHLPRDLANVNAWNTMFDPYIVKQHKMPSHSSFIKVNGFISMLLFFLFCFNSPLLKGEQLFGTSCLLPLRMFSKMRLIILGKKQ